MKKVHRLKVLHCGVTIRVGRYTQIYQSGRDGIRPSDKSSANPHPLFLVFKLKGNKMNDFKWYLLFMGFLYLGLVVYEIIMKGCFK